MTTYRTVPVEIVGQTYQHRSRPLSSQVTMNLIPEFEITGISETALISWPGSKQFSGSAGGDRGMTVFQNTLYHVSGNALYSVSKYGVKTPIGTISGANRCIFANDGNSLIITTGSIGYIFSGGTLSTISDPDFQNGNSCAYLNQQMIYDGDGGKFQVSSVGNPGDLPSNNFATAESAPDDTIRVFVFNEKLYLFGRRTVETWYNSGVGSPPFDRVNGGTMNIGLSAVHAVSATDSFVYWLGDDRGVYRTSAYQAENITSIGIGNALESFDDVSDAIMYIVTIDSQNFVVLTLESANKTFVFNERSQSWFQLSTGAQQDRYIGNSYQVAYGKKLIASKKEGGICELDTDVYTDNGEAIIRQRVTSPISGALFGEPGKRLLMSRFQIVMEAGVGLPVGQGEIPQIMLEASFDGGKSWTNQDTVEIGRAGEGRTKIEWYHIESFYDASIRITVSDPVPINIYSAAMDVKVAGW